MSANAYGTIGVCGGYEGDLKRIVDILNDWRGEDESNYFVEDGVISINASEDEYPDIWPRYQWFVSDQGWPQGSARGFGRTNK